MLVLVATKETQGRQIGDYSWTVEGELVTPVAVECCVPDSCGCGRGFPGLVSGKATTTASVVDRTAITPSLLRQSVADSLERGGWRAALDDTDFDDIVDEHVDTVAQVCRAFGEGAVVRRDGSSFWADMGRSAA